jgi:energy-coupling factor transporter ATP-binding protein EcfA2
VTDVADRPAQQDNSLLQAALDYAARGWYVFPVHDVAGGKCSCERDRSSGCSSPGKHPRTTHGLHDATTDPVAIAAWWAQWPQANVAIDCGRSNLTVVDVDVKNGAEGKATLKWVLERHAETFAAAELVGSPTGGYHYYFEGAGTMPHHALGPGIDMQSTGRYVLAPPSRAFSQYDAEKNPVAGSQGAYRLLRAAPTLIPLPADLYAPVEQSFSLGDIAGNERIFEGDARDRIPYGEHRTALLWLTWHLRRVHGLTINASIPMVQAFLSTLDGYNPAIPFTESDIRKMLAKLDPHVATAPPTVISNPLLGAITGVQAQLHHRPMSWIIPYFFPDHELTLLYGEGGTGKSTLFSWLASVVTRLGGNFGVVGIEEPFERFVARAVAMGADPARLIAPAESAVGLKFREHLDWIEAFIAEYDLRYLYFDSLRTHFDGAKGEDAATSARNNLSGIAALAQRSCAIGASFHTNKEAIYSGSTEMLNVPRIVLEAKNPSENKLTIRVHKGNFKKPDYKLAFMHEEIPYFVNGAPVMQSFQEIGEEPYYEQETLPIWHRLANEPVKGGSLEEIAGVELAVRELLENNPSMNGREVFEIVGGNRKKVFEAVKRIRDERA